MDIQVIHVPGISGKQDYIQFLITQRIEKKKPTIFLFQRYGSYCPVCSILWSNKDTVPSLVKTKRVSFSAISIFSALSGNIFTEYYPFFQLFPVIFLQKYDHKNAAFKWQHNHIT